MPARVVASAPLAGHVKLDLIRALAAGKVRRSQLAKDYGVSPAAITAFASRNALAIQMLHDDLQAEMKALWIAEKAARVAEYQQDVDDINGSEHARREAVKTALGDTLDVQAALAESEGLAPDPAQLRGKHRALRSVAEELGQLPARVTVEIGDTHVRHELVGVDIDDV